MRPALLVSIPVLVAAPLAVVGLIVLLVAEGGMWTGIGIVLVAAAALIVGLAALAGVVAGADRRGSEGRPGAPGPR